MEKTIIKKPLETFEFGPLPAGSEITLTGEWDSHSYGSGKARVILDSLGRRCRVLDVDLEDALLGEPER